MVIMNKNMDNKVKREMMEKIDQVDGVKWTISMNSLFGPTIPDSMIPKDVKKMLQSDSCELAFICSEYESATPKVNKQIAEIDKIVKASDRSSMVIGEAPLMKDLQDVTDTDLKTVNAISIVAIFIIIFFVFKSFLLPIILVSVIEFAIFVNMAIPFYQGTSLPFVASIAIFIIIFFVFKSFLLPIILVSVIEFAIFVNMAIPFYQGTSLPFVASIVIGTIQLGATVDYAILMTSRYQKERIRGKAKMEAISIAHKTSMLSIISSGLSFFAATFGVALYSKVDMIGSICTLLARGALISMCVVILILPAMFMIFDKPIIMTTFGKSPELKALIGSICTLLARGALISMCVVILILPAMFMIFDKPIIMTTFGKSPELKVLKERSKHHE